MKPHHIHLPLLAIALTLSAFSLQAFRLSAAAPVAAVQSRAEIESGLKSHDRALFITTGWIRDPYIVLGPDGYYYLTGTTPDENDPREQTDPYNTGLGATSLVGSSVRLWRSKDLVDWEYRGVIFSLSDTARTDAPPSKAAKKAKAKGKTASATPAAPATKGVLWAPELHWLGDRWALIHCPKSIANFALGPIGEKEPKGPWTQPLGNKLGDKHDPSLLKDTDGTLWVIWQNATVAPLNKTMTDWAAKPVDIAPSGSRTSKLGGTRSTIGHEGTTIIQVPGSDKYVFIGTAWSTDGARKGSYNLYYCTADKITGPYGPRHFVGRFLGHSVPFQTKDGQWWTGAFYNSNNLPLPREGIETRDDIGSDAYTINQRGLTIVPLDVHVLPDGDVYMRATDPAYATPGPDEVQKFDK